MTVLCRKLGVTRGGFYAWLNREKSKRALRDEAILEHIIEVHRESGHTYGYPRVHQALRRRNVYCGRHKVARIMRMNGIKAKGSKRFKYHQNLHYLHHDTPNRLLGKPKPRRRNAVWVGDVTYIRVGQDWQYLSVVMDLYTRKVIGWHFSKERNAALAKEALLMALEDNKVEKTIFHSDQGSEYVNKAYRKCLKDHHIKASISRKGHCWDNASMESFFHSLKVEMVYFCDFKTIEEAISYIMRYLYFYNHERLHSSLEYQSPVEFDLLAA